MIKVRVNGSVGHKIMATVETYFDSYLRREGQNLPTLGFAQRIRDGFVDLGLKTVVWTDKWLKRIGHAVREEAFPDEDTTDGLRFKLQQQPIREVRYDEFPALPELLPNTKTGTLPPRNYTPANRAKRKEIMAACTAAELTVKVLKEQPAGQGHSNALVLDMITSFYDRFMPYLTRPQMAGFVNTALDAVLDRRERSLFERAFYNPGSLTPEKTGKALAAANRIPLFDGLEDAEAYQPINSHNSKLAETFFDGYKTADGTIIGAEKPLEEFVMAGKNKRARLYQVSDQYILNSIKQMVERNQMSNVKFQTRPINKETAKFTKKHARFFNGLDNLSRAVAEHALEDLLVKRKRSIAHSPEALKRNKVKRLIKQGRLTSQHLTKDGAIDPNELAFDRFFVEQPGLVKQLSNFVVPKRQRNSMPGQRESLIAYPPVATRAALVDSLIEGNKLGTHHLTWFGVIDPNKLAQDDFFIRRPALAGQLVFHELPEEQWGIISSKGLDAKLSNERANMDMRKIGEEAAKGPVNFSPDVSIPEHIETAGTALYDLPARNRELDELKGRQRMEIQRRIDEENKRKKREWQKYLAENWQTVTRAYWLRWSLESIRRRREWEKQYPELSWSGSPSTGSFFENGREERRAAFHDLLSQIGSGYEERGDCYVVRSVNPKNPNAQFFVDTFSRYIGMRWEPNSLPGHVDLEILKKE